MTERPPPMKVHVLLTKLLSKACVVVGLWLVSARLGIVTCGEFASGSSQPPTSITHLTHLASPNPDCRSIIQQI